MHGLSASEEPGMFSCALSESIKHVLSFCNQDTIMNPKSPFGRLSFTGLMYRKTTIVFHTFFKRCHSETH